MADPPARATHAVRGRLGKRLAVVIGIGVTVILAAVLVQGPPVQQQTRDATTVFTASHDAPAADTVLDAPVDLTATGCWGTSDGEVRSLVIWPAGSQITAVRTLHVTGLGEVRPGDRVRVSGHWVADDQDLGLLAHGCGADGRVFVADEPHV